jgi:hypothetical protein
MFAKHMTALSVHEKKGHKVVNQGKGAKEQVLPDRSDMETLTGGKPTDRFANKYGKTPPQPASPSTPAPQALNTTGEDSDAFLGVG